VVILERPESVTNRAMLPGARRGGVFVAGAGLGRPLSDEIENTGGSRAPAGPNLALDDSALRSAAEHGIGETVCLRLPEDESFRSLHFVAGTRIKRGVRSRYPPMIQIT
jgi:hypothetical protein